MFSGIIEQVGRVEKLMEVDENISLALHLDLSRTTLNIGDSVCVNGVCLTVKKISDNICYFDISPETYNLTALKYLNNDKMVNIEFPLTLEKFINGHLTTGHVDSLGTIKSLKKIKDSWEIFLEVDLSILKYLIHKGSISIDGVSLTINKISHNIIDLMIIPHTYENTIFKYYKIEQKVNIEVDYISKHLEKLKND